MRSVSWLKIPLDGLNLFYLTRLRSYIVFLKVGLGVYNSMFIKAIIKHTRVLHGLPYARRALF